NDTSKIKLLNKISFHLAVSNPSASLVYADSSIKLSQTCKLIDQMAEAYNYQGEALRNQGMFLESIKKHEYALGLFQGINDTLSIAQTESAIGICYFSLSDFSKAYKHFDRSRDTYEIAEDYNGLSSVYSYMGIVFNEFKEYDKALEYFNKSLDYAILTNDKSSQATQYNNIALTYEALENYEDAIKYYNDGIGIFKNLNDKFNYSIGIGNIGIPYAKLGKYSEAKECFYESLNLAVELNDSYGIAHQYGNLGELFMTMGKDKNLHLIEDLSQEYNKKAVEYFNLSIEEFDELGAIADQKDYLELLSQTYKSLHDYKNAYNLLNRYLVLKDSIQYQENQKIISNLEINQELKNKKNEIVRLNKDRAYQSQITTILIIFLTFILLVVFIVYFLFFKQKKANSLLEINIKRRIEVEESLRQNEVELNAHKNNLENLVKNRTIELEKEIVEHKETEEALLMAIERAEIANNAKSVFLANMSHELRTPLVGILGYSDLLVNTVENIDAKEMAEGINRTGNRLLNTLSLVLDLARIESDKFEIDISEVDIIDELRDTYLNFKALAEKKNLKLTLNVHADSFVQSTDVSMIKVILDNLVNNAIKFTHEGGVTISSDVDFVDGETRLLIEVADTGVGINKKEIPLIFEEFKQLSEGFTKDFQGSGLGLSITKKFVELLGGIISAESEIGVGTTFTVSFPTKSAKIKDQSDQNIYPIRKAN
ncbi:MAG: tetratricopeptide repeat protein, partial [Melioribacteraceae bacterium]|nr:tetratricopeptide repeat protein [Melioribacteraceae bacterium]